MFFITCWTFFPSLFVPPPPELEFKNQTNQCFQFPCIPWQSIAHLNCLLCQEPSPYSSFCTSLCWFCWNTSHSLPPFPAVNNLSLSTSFRIPHPKDHCLHLRPRSGQQDLGQFIAACRRNSCTFIYPCDLALNFFLTSSV